MEDFAFKENFLNIETLKLLISELRVRLENLIRDNQEKCQHEFFKIMLLDPSFSSFPSEKPNKGELIFTGKKCFKCNLFIPRKIGFPSAICYKCGEKMEYIGADYSILRPHMLSCSSCGSSYYLS